MQTHQIKTVAIVYKRTVYQNYVSNASRTFKKKSHTHHFLKTHHSHQAALQEVISFFKLRGIKTISMPREKMKSLGTADFVVTVGGDGTFLKASHYIEGQPVLGVNSVPGTSVGALLSVTISQFSSKMKQILEGKYKVEKINRLEISVNGKKKRERPLNDILFANQSPAGVCRYEIKIGSKKEAQRGSGIWISTAIGSSAAIYAAGGKIMPRHSSRIQFLVREPFSGHCKHPYKILNGTVHPDKSLDINNQTIHAALYIDGLQAIYPLRFGDHIEIRNAPVPLSVICP